MRVCHVCNGHTADDSRVFHRTCCELAKAGYEVHLFARGKGKTAYTEKGVVVHPLPEPGNRWQRYTRASRVAQLAADLKPDLFHVHEPDLLGSVIARAGSRPVVYDVHESYLDMLTENTWLPFWTKPLVRIVWNQWESRLVRRCAGIVTVTDTIAKRYSALHTNVHIVANYPELSKADDPCSGTRDGRTCVIAGALNQDRGLSQALEALAILKRRDLEVRLALAGPSISADYLESLWREAERLGVRNQVQYHGILSKKEAVLFQGKADIGLVIYQPLLYCVNSLPNKLVECMSLGLPVVFSNFPNYCEIAEKAGAGIKVDPTKPELIADAIESLVRNPVLAKQMGEAGKSAVRNRFNWQVESAKLLDLYSQLIGGPQHVRV